MASDVYPPATSETGERRRALAPEIHRAFDEFSRQVFVGSALPGKTKQLIAVAAAYVTQCRYCISGHTRLARRAGASDQEIMEAIWVAAEMQAGGAFAHPTAALHAPAWMAQALCTRADPDLWYPEHPSDQAYQAAITICAGCPVRDRCLDHALATGEVTEGIWGGMTPAERQAEQRRRNKDVVAAGKKRVA